MRKQERASVKELRNQTDLKLPVKGELNRINQEFDPGS